MVDDGVIPFTMEFVPGDVEGGHLGIGDDKAFGIEVLVDVADHGEAGKSRSNAKKTRSAELRLSDAACAAAPSGNALLDGAPRAT